MAELLILLSLFVFGLGIALILIKKLRSPDAGQLERRVRQRAEIASLHDKTKALKEKAEDVEARVSRLNAMINSISGDEGTGGGSAHKDSPVTRGNGRDRER